MRAYMSPEGGRRASRSTIPAELADQAAQYREKLVDAVVETDEALMERYLEERRALGRGDRGRAEERGHARRALPGRLRRRDQEPRHDGLLDLLVEGVPSPAKKPPIEIEANRDGRVRLQDDRRPVRRADQRLPRPSGQVGPTRTSSTRATKRKERIGQVLLLQGKEHSPADASGAGDIGAVAKLKDVHDRRPPRSTRTSPVEAPALDFPQPVMSFAITPKAKGEEEKLATALRRLAEEDPTLVMRRDQQTGEQLLAGLSQMHVEVAVDRLKRRFGVEVDLHQPRVPYLETIRSESRAQGKLQEADGRPRPVRRLPHRARAARRAARATSSSTRSSAA